MYLCMREMCKIKLGQGKHRIALPAASCEACNIKSRYTNILVYGGNGVNIIITRHTQFPYNSNHYNFYFQPLLKPLTKREGYSYKKIVENLQKGLYIPYTIIEKALRLFTNIPSVYYKCKTISSSSETTKSKKEVKTFKLHATYPVTD